MSDADRSRRFADLAPLTKSFAMHLASYQLRTRQRPAGRPHKTEGEDVVTRAERGMLEAMDRLIPLVHAKRQAIYDLVHPVFSSGNLTNKWLLQTLSQFTPGTMMVYPQRLAEWRQAHVLLSNEDGNPEPNSVCCLLLARTINPNRTGWLPRPPAPASFWCWRQDAPNIQPYPFELPLVALNQEHPGVARSILPVQEHPYLLSTTWKGATWDSPEWMLVEDMAMRWVGEPDESIVSRWLSAQELEQFSALGGAGVDESGARLALQFLAHRLIHGSSSNNSSYPT